jgi:hypothetical protein
MNDKRWFKTTAIFFIGVFVYYATKNGVTMGAVKTSVAWALSVVATPIPIGGILLSFPINVFTNFPMAQTQLIVSGVALYMLWYWPYSLGGLIEGNKYAVYGTCIASSVLISYMINQEYSGKPFDRRLWFVVAALLGLYGALLTLNFAELVEPIMGRQFAVVPLAPCEICQG